MAGRPAVCIHAHVYTHIHMRMFTHIYIPIHTYTYPYTHIHILSLAFSIPQLLHDARFSVALLGGLALYEHEHVYTHIHTHTHIHLYTRSRFLCLAKTSARLNLIGTYSRVLPSIYVRTYTHIYTLIHFYTFIHGLSLAVSLTHTSVRSILGCADSGDLKTVYMNEDCMHAHVYARIHTYTHLYWCSLSHALSHTHPRALDVELRILGRLAVCIRTHVYTRVLHTCIHVYTCTLMFSFVFSCTHMCLLHTYLGALDVELRILGRLAVCIHVHTCTLMFSFAVSLTHICLLHAYLRALDFELRILGGLAVKALPQIIRLSRGRIRMQRVHPVCVTWLIHQWHTLVVWHDVFSRDMAHRYATGLIHMWRDAIMCDMFHMWHERKSTSHSTEDSNSRSTYVFIIEPMNEKWR